MEEEEASLSSAEESRRTEARPVEMAYSEDEEREEPFPPSVTTEISSPLSEAIVCVFFWIWKMSE